ncbi:MAG: class I SAM-dependent methyltransferase [Bryobacteraceae bacterium]
MSKKLEIRLDPVLAYDRIAAFYPELSARRKAYLTGIEGLIVAEIPQAAKSLLDVGAGDGTRALRIGEATGITDLVLLEPSAAMRAHWPAHVRGWPIRAEDLHAQKGSFDVIICLWNVLGHIFPAINRVWVLRQCARLLSPNGLLFIDVNHRYNARCYGALPTALRALRDRLSPNEKNGDVISRWKVDGAIYAADGHVFTDAEFRRVTAEAGLSIKSQVAVDYETGDICRSSFSGNLFYVIQRAKSG